MDKKSSRKRLQMSKFKLDSLLEITRSINANLSADELLAKYEGILRDDLNIGKIIIFKFSDTWDCILNAGFDTELETSINPAEKLLEFEDTVILPHEESRGLPDVEIIIPVYNNNVPLAYILIGDIEEEGSGMSPILKHLRFIQIISSIIIVAIENIRLFQETLQQEIMRKELELAAKMQTMLIPDNNVLPNNENIEVTGYYHPHYDVGGDYYDCMELNNDITGFCIADVSGKGVSAAILMSNFQASFRALFTAEVDLETLIQKLNEVVVRNASGEKFITFFVARYNHKTRILEFINAAHNSPVIYDMINGETVHLEASCVGIGMLDEIPFISSSSRSIPNKSKIVLYTDGLSELKDEEGEDIGTVPVIEHIRNKQSIEQNIKKLIKDLGIPDENPHMFDDVSIIAATLF